MMTRLFALLAVLALLTAPATARSIATAKRVSPLSLRIQHHDVLTHPDLVIDTPTPHFSWQLQSLDATSRGVAQVAYQLQVLDSEGSLVHDSGKVMSSQSTYVQYNGEPLEANTRYTLRVRYWSTDSDNVSGWSDSTFRTALLDTWAAVPWQWIGRTDIAYNEIRRPFAISKTVKSATAFISGIGYYHLFINGENVDPSRRLDPGWTTYERRVLYASYDVSKLVSSGANCIGVWLGSGWYSQEQYVSGTDEGSYGPPRLLFWLNIVYTDGSSDDIYSDVNNGWTGRTGATLHDGVYMGTIYDARNERDGWSTAGFVDNTTLWLSATLMPSPLGTGGVLSLQTHDPIRMAPDNLHIATSARLHPRSLGQSPLLNGADLFSTSGGVITPVSIGATEGQLFDLGQNMAGWCIIKAKGRRGLAIHIKYAETLQLKGNPQSDHGIYTENLRNAASTDIYIFKSDETVETIEPRFTYHGFRYLEIRGAKHGIDASDIQCYFVHSETTMKGNFTSNNMVMDQVQHNIQWGQLSNLMSLPTDCDQRDERKGWMGDAGLTVDEALFNFELAAFYHNFMALIHDVQKADGGVPDTVPLTFGNNPADPNWGTAYPTIAWYLYNHYGDTTILSAHFTGLVGWVEKVRGGYNSTGLKGLWYEYGDWVPPPPYGQSNGQLIASFPFLRDVMTVSKIAAVLNKTDISNYYANFYTQLAKEFHSTFYHNDSIGYADGMQTANALALALPGVVPSDKKDAVVTALVNDINAKGALTTGIVGTAQLFPMLSDNGHHDLALMLAQSTKYPSHGYMAFNDVENATTLWELWDSPREGPGMNSRNHIMFGSIGAWFYRYVAGVNPNALNTIEIRPRMAINGALMPALHAEVHTIKGEVSVDYERDIATNTVTMTVTVPHNTDAMVSFEPLTESKKCLEIHEGQALIYSSQSHSLYKKSVLSVSEVEGVKSVVRDASDGTMHVKAGSGSYQFTARWA